MYLLSCNFLNLFVVNLGASLWFAFSLKLDCQAIELHAKLPEMESICTGMGNMH